MHNPSGTGEAGAPEASELARMLLIAPCNSHYLGSASAGGEESGNLLGVKILVMDRSATGDCDEVLVGPAQGGGERGRRKGGTVKADDRVRGLEEVLGDGYGVGGSRGGPERGGAGTLEGNGTGFGRAGSVGGVGGIGEAFRVEEAKGFEHSVGAGTDSERNDGRRSDRNHSIDLRAGLCGAVELNKDGRTDDVDTFSHWKRGKDVSSPDTSGSTFMLILLFL